MTGGDKSGQPAACRNFRNNSFSVQAACSTHVYLTLPPAGCALPYLRLLPPAPAPELLAALPPRLGV